jgi:hypothetical protein
MGVFLGVKPAATLVDAGWTTRKISTGPTGVEDADQLGGFAFVA